MYVINPDRAIQSVKEDAFDRKEIAHRAACEIIRYKENDPLVIAFDGPWGAGKTSMKNMVLEYIRKKPDDGLRIVEFCPWNFSDAESLTKLFFEELAQKFHCKGGGKVRKAMHAMTGRYSLKAAWDEFGVWGAVVATSLVSAGVCEQAAVEGVLSIIAMVLVGSLLLFNMLKFAFLHLLSAFFRSDLSLEERKRGISEALIKSGVDKVLVVIDDVDRLNNEKIRCIIQFVKCQADINNFVFLLLFDRKIVDDALGKSRSGVSYLDKIVQVVYPIPRPQAHCVMNFFVSELEKLFGAHGIEICLRHNDEHYVDVVAPFIKSQRDVKRLINSMVLPLETLVVGGKIEVVPVDFIIIEVLRLFEPEVYLYIYKEKLFLTKTGVCHDVNADKLSDEDIWKERLMEYSSSTNRDAVEKAVSFLFYAKLSKSDQIMKIFNVKENEGKIPLGIQSQINFDTYFYYQLTEGVAPQYVVDSLAKSSHSLESLTYKITEFLSLYPKLVGQLLRTWHQFLEYKVENLFVVLMNMYPQNKTRDRFNRSILEQLLCTIWESFRYEEQVYLLEYAVECANVIDLVPRFIFALQERHGLEEERLIALKKEAWVTLQAQIDSGQYNLADDVYIRHLFLLWPSESSAIRDRFIADQPNEFLLGMARWGWHDTKKMNWPYFEVSDLKILMDKDGWNALAEKDGLDEVLLMELRRALDEWKDCGVLRS